MRTALGILLRHRPRPKLTRMTPKSWPVKIYLKPTLLVCPTDPDQFVYESMESGEKKIQQIECMEKVLHL